MKNFIQTGNKKIEISEGTEMNTLFPEKPQVVKSVMDNDRDILAAIRVLYLNNSNFHLDPCFSVGCCANCGRAIEPLNKCKTNSELEDFYESNYECPCGIRIDWSNQIIYK